MTAGTYCSREVVVAKPKDSIRTACDLMRRHHVGDIVVVDGDVTPPRPKGIITDRDIVLEILAKDVDLDAVVIGDIMTREIVTTEENTELIEVIRLMQVQGVRRIPVVDRQGSLVGIISSDDIIEVIADEMSGLSGLLKRELAHEKSLRV